MRDSHVTVFKAHTIDARSFEAWSMAFGGFDGVCSNPHITASDLGDAVDRFTWPYLYSNPGSHRPIAGNVYSNASAMTCMPMNGIMPANIWFSVTCLGETPFR